MVDKAEAASTDSARGSAELTCSFEALLRFPICKVGQMAQLLPASQVLQKDKVTHKHAKAVKLI